jgi:hypothetical protein
MSLCRGPVCSEKVVAKGLCSAHYKQLQRDGILHAIEKSKLPEDKFWKNIRRDANECWTWTGPVDKGYGRMYVGNKAFQAHRWSYEQHMHVSLTKVETLDHLCRNTLCCNPEHLEKLSLIENIERQHLYHAMRAEINRLRGFLEDIGYNPDSLQKEM